MNSLKSFQSINFLKHLKDKSIKIKIVRWSFNSQSSFFFILVGFLKILSGNALFSVLVAVTFIQVFHPSSQQLFIIENN